MRVNATLQADLAVITDALNVAPRTTIALPPSYADPLTDEMRVLVQGVLISRAFDPEDPIVTGGPFALLTESGDTLTTEAGARLVTEVGA